MSVSSRSRAARVRNPRVTPRLLAQGAHEALWEKSQVGDCPRDALERLKNSLSVEHPIAGDELRAIERYLATREDELSWLLISERDTQLTRQAINYIIWQAAETARLKHVRPRTLRRSPSWTPSWREDLCPAPPELRWLMDGRKLADG